MRRRRVGRASSPRSWASAPRPMRITSPPRCPSGEAAAAAVTTAMADAHAAADEIGYVNAHASSTELNELAEARALHLALGAHAATVPVSGTKGLYGHALGASGAIEAAIVTMALERGTLPGTCNLGELDDRLGLNVLREAMAARPDCGAVDVVRVRRPECRTRAARGSGIASAGPAVRISRYMFPTDRGIRARHAI